MQEFYEILKNPYFSVGLGILGLVLAILGIHLTRKSFKKKSLIVNDWNNKELISKPRAQQSKLKILLDNIEIDGLNELKITLQNRGNVEIQKKDLAYTPTINFTDKIKIIDYSVTDYKNYTKANISLKNKKTATFFFDLLEPKDKFDIKILYAYKHTTDASIDLKIIGGNELRVRAYTDDEDGVRKGLKLTAGMESLFFTFLTCTIVFLILFSFKYFGILNENYFLFSLLTLIPVFIIAIKKFLQKELQAYNKTLKEKLETLRKEKV